MKYISVLVIVDGELQTYEGLVYENKLWIVPLWFEDKEQKASKPVRMIRFDNLHHDAGMATATGHDYILNQPIPKAVLDGQTREGYDTLWENEITFWLRLPLSNSH
jgi:hypothetical protein